MIFEVGPDQVSHLDSAGLVQLMRRLMLAESRKAGIPLRATMVPLQITVADGGEDGRVEWTGGEAETPYFPNRFSLLQAKAQNLTESSIRTEVMKVHEGTKRLSPALTEVLDRNGAYVVFCSRPFVTSKQRKLVSAIRTAIVEAGRKPDEASAILIYDANIIADWANSHPSVALWLAARRLGTPLGGFQTHEQWGKAPSVAGVPWQASDEPRFVPINWTGPKSGRRAADRNGWTFEEAASEIRSSIASPRSIVRIAGPSGFGKSRSVHRALSSTNALADDVDNASVIFCDGSFSGDEALKLTLELADIGAAGVIVVDECPDELHNKLAEHVRRTDSRLALITIDIETKVVQSPSTLTIRLERASDSHIEDIAKGIAPAISETDRRFIAELSAGFPRMAVMAAEHEGQSRPTFESASQILERVIWSGKPSRPEAQRALEFASLFEWFGLEGRVAHQLDYIASIAGTSAPRLREHLLSFRSRGILTKRGDFAQVGPIPLAARLGLSRLEATSAADLADMFTKAPDELRASMLSRMRWLDTSPTALAFAGIVLSPEALGNLAALRTEFGARTLDRLVHVAPDLAAHTIERVFGSLSHDELKAVRDGRRHLVWALEKLVFRRSTFCAAATMLRRLGSAEVEHVDNNAAGEFKTLFQLYLSGTEADPKARLLVLDEGLRSEVPEERALCVAALGRMVSSGHFYRSGGSEQIGSAEALVDWSPSTYGEISDFHRAAMDRLADIATGNDPLSETAKELIGREIRSLLNNLPAPEITAMIERIREAHGFWPEALQGVSSWLYFDRGEADPATAGAVRAMYDDLMPGDLLERMSLFTAGWAIDLHDPDTTYRRGQDTGEDHRYAERKAIELAVAIGARMTLARKAISRLASGDAKSPLAFAKQLAFVAPDPVALFRHAIRSAELSMRPVNLGVFAGLVAGADARDPAMRAELVRLALASKKLRSEAMSLIGAGSSAPGDLELVISLLASGDVRPWQSVALSYGRRLDLLSPKEILPLLQELERHGAEGIWSALEITLMYRHGKPLDPVLATSAKRTLLKADLLSAIRNNMDGHHLEQIVAALLETRRIKKAYAVRLARHLLRICRRGSGTLFSQLDDPIRKILGQLVPIAPEAVWAEIAKQLLSPSPDVRSRAKRLLAGRNRDDHLLSRMAVPVPAGLLLDWIRNDSSTRAHLGVDWIPLTTTGPDGTRRWAPELESYVDEFADCDHVLAALTRRLRPTSWVGGLAPYLEPAIPLLHGWLGHRRASVRAWVRVTVDWLARTIEEDRKRSEEDVVRFG